MRAGFATCVLRRAAALLAGLALLAMAPTAAATGQSAMIRVGATIMSYVKVLALSNPSTLEVSLADVARGYVDVEAASSVSLVTNSHDGYTITAAWDPSTVARASMRALGHAGGVDAGQERLHVPAAPFVKTVVRLGFRLYLTSEVSAGRYPWPVALSVSNS